MARALAQVSLSASKGSVTLILYKDYQNIRDSTQRIDSTVEIDNGSSRSSEKHQQSQLINPTFFSGHRDVCVRSCEETVSRSEEEKEIQDWSKDW
jgi:hypothetical protein